MTETTENERRHGWVFFDGACGFCRRGLPPCTVTKEGQKPFTQEKSLLQVD